MQYRNSDIDNMPLVLHSHDRYCGRAPPGLTLPTSPLFMAHAHGLSFPPTLNKYYIVLSLFQVSVVKAGFFWGVSYILRKI